MNQEVKKEIKKILKCNNYNNINEIDWTHISMYCVLSYGFIREFQDKVNWYYIAYCQDLSNDFIREFKDKLDLNLMLKKKKISQKLYNELTHKKTRFELLDFE